MMINTKRYFKRWEKTRLLRKNFLRNLRMPVAVQIPGRSGHKKMPSVSYVIAVTTKMKTWLYSAVIATYLCIRAAMVLNNYLKKTGYATIANFLAWREDSWSPVFSVQRREVLWSRQTYAHPIILSCVNSKLYNSNLILISQREGP